MAAPLLGLGLTREARAMGESARFALGVLAHTPGHQDPRPGALRRLLLEVEQRTSVTVRGAGALIDPMTDELFQYPMLFMAGQGDFAPWSQAMVTRMQTWLRGGGFLVVDSLDGLSDGPFLKAARRELERVYPAQKPVVLGGDHVLYKSFYLIKEPVGRVHVASTMAAIVEPDRAPVVFSANDLMGAWARDGFGKWDYEVTPGGARQRELAFRVGINLVMYALCGDYKADQVHIPFILKRRQWRVE